MTAKLAADRPPTSSRLGRLVLALICLSGSLPLAAAAAAATIASAPPGERGEALAWTLLASGVLPAAEHRAPTAAAANVMLAVALGPSGGALALRSWRQGASAPLGVVAPGTGCALAQGSPLSAAGFIGRLHHCATAAMADPSLDRRQRKQALLGLIRRDFDLETIGLFALGRYRRGATESERKQYLALFEGRLVESHFAKLQDYADGGLEIVAVRDAGTRNTFVVTEMVRRQGAPWRVEWRVRRGRQGYKIVDVVVEGVSMVISQRAEVASVMRSNGGRIEGLLAALHATAAAD